MATGDRGGWRDVIQVVLYAEFFLARAGVMLNAPLEGAKTIQDVLHGRVIVSAVCLLGGIALMCVFLARGSLFGLIYFTVLPLVDALLLSRLQKLRQEVRHA